jgi:2-phospho-L-lactate/phosphoenolpyruvate guanylyltransferase
MATVAILPVKSFREAKQRLDPSLEAGPRRLLAEAMFADVLVALRRSRSIQKIVVVSTDHRAQSIAGAYGASLLAEDDRGHNYAAARGIRRALDEGTERVLLVPGDCPALDPAHVDALVARPIDAPSALIVPDRHGTGTNALLLTPPNALEPSFGPGSCQRHEAGASSAGVNHEVVDVPTLGLDIDTADDLEALRSMLAGTHGGAAHTRGMLRRLARGED